jgi:hypothetical protein
MNAQLHFWAKDDDGKAGRRATELRVQVPGKKGDTFIDIPLRDGLHLFTRTGWSATIHAPVVAGGHFTVESMGKTERLDASTTLFFEGKDTDAIACNIAERLPAAKDGAA